MRTTDFRLADALGNSLGDKRLDILRRIGETGSISSAARAAGVSYKAAWQAIETLANLAGTPLVAKAVGGSGGGGANLTPAGITLLATAEKLDRARAAVLAELTEAGDSGAKPGQTRTRAGVGVGVGARTTSDDKAGGRHRSEGHPAPGLGPIQATTALGLKTSMRNHLPCRVASIRASGALVSVSLALADGSTLASRITRESVELLDLRPDMPALALCKATAVTIAARLAEQPGRNHLTGKVARVQRAGEGAEISILLGSGLHLVGFAQAGHGLKRGMAAEAAIEESAVVIGVAG